MLKLFQKKKRKKRKEKKRKKVFFLGNNSLLLLIQKKKKGNWNYMYYLVINLPQLINLITQVDKLFKLNVITWRHKQITI